ncbi:MAG: hypothetical protein E7004_03005 [Alphaproteobacteria bacterium]|nr:hypothetical protein [Alphaproteobacteria bacterium]
MLNFIWAGFFIVAFISAIFQSFDGNAAIWSHISESLFSTAHLGFKIALDLTGVLCFWLGLMKIAEKSGLSELLAKVLKPLFHKIMPEIKKDSPAFGAIVMNIASNILGLDNAATPMGIKAMELLQKENKSKTEASNAQILFMVINSSAVTLIPITILMYRFQAGSANPASVFIPILIATSISTLSGFLATVWWQKINILNRVVMSYVMGGIAFIGLSIWGFYELDAEARTQISYIMSNAILYGLVIAFIVSGLIKKLNVFELFIEGAKDGFKTAVQIIPYLVAMLVAIGVFRSSGALDYIIDFIKLVVTKLGINSDFVYALPTAIMKPLSGSGARAMMLDTFNTYGVDSFAGFVSSIVQGSTETTFYVLAVYFGAVKISNTRSALPLALFADVMGIVSAILLAYLFY